MCTTPTLDKSGSNGCLKCGYPVKVLSNGQLRHQKDEEEGFKNCNQCDRLQPYSQFHKQRENKDGYHRECKRCASMRKRNYRFLTIKIPISFYSTAAGLAKKKNMTREEFILKALRAEIERELAVLREEKIQRVIDGKETMK